jgi:homoserine kinase
VGKYKSGIKVFAPATVANMACGFDCLGFALNQPGDEIIVTLNDSRKGLKVTEITGAGGKLPYEIEKNTAAWAAHCFLESIGESDRGIDMEIHKKMPFGSGLGSSAASAVAGVFAVNALTQQHPFTKKELISFAMDGEELASGARHADNIAPCLFGGITMVRDNSTLDIHRLSTPRGLHATVIYPHVEILTKEARGMLSKEITLKQHIQQSSNMGGLIVGLYNGDFDLIGRSLQDVIIEPQRAKLIPFFYEVQEAAMKAGALGCSISGSGPSIFALSANSLIAEEAGLAMQKIFKENKIRNELYVSPINQEGVILL